MVGLRAQIDEAKKTILEPLQAQRDELQKDLLQHMAKQGFVSVKTDTATVSRQISKKLSIQDENVLIADLKKRGFTDYITERVNKDVWDPFAREAVKSGVAFAGTEIVETEFVSIRKAKPKSEGGGDNE